MAGLIVKPRSRILHGHDWVYASEVLKVYGAPEDGEVIYVKDGRDRLLGSAIYNSRSPIAARRFSRFKQALDGDFLRQRLFEAVRRRAGLPPERPVRLCWSDSDGLPGLVVDRYGGCAVMQTLTPGMERVLPEVVRLLPEVAGVRTIFERNDASGRGLEGLPLRTGRPLGEDPAEVEFTWCGVEWRVDLLAGQKTGFYLDQLESYRAVASRASGVRVLDCFSNQGGFALTCARAGASGVVAVESSVTAIARLLENVRRNGLESVDAQTADVFVYLRRAEKAGQRFGGIVLDPPSFARGRAAVQEALRGYRELHLRAARLLEPGGWLASFSCSHQISAADFLQAAREGAAAAGRRFLVEERLQQPMDHPVALHLPESEYLKGFILREAGQR